MECGIAVGQHHVAAAQFDPVDTQFAGGGIDQALDQIVAFGTAGAAVGVHRNGVGEHAEHVGVDRLEAIDAGEHAGAGEGRDKGREGGQIGAHVGNIACPQRDEFAVGVDRQFAERQVVAALGVAEEGLAAVGCPFHRAPEFAGGVTGQHMFGVEK